MKTPLHKHLMLRGEILDPPKDTEIVINWTRELIEVLGMKILDRNGKMEHQLIQSLLLVYLKNMTFQKESFQLQH